MDTNVIRFAVGSPETLQSHVWRVWVQKDEIYIGTRGMKMNWKVSLHKSGIWRIATVKELHSPDVDSDRVIVKWRRPKEDSAGWIPSVNILVSSVGPEKPLAAFSYKESKIEWFTPPKKGKKLIFKIFLSVPAVSLDSGNNLLVQHGYRVIRSMKKLNGETVWFVMAELDVDAVEYEKIKQVIAKTKINIAPTKNKNPVKNARALLIISDDEPTSLNQPTILDIALGKENVFIENL